MPVIAADRVVAKLPATRLSSGAMTSERMARLQNPVRGASWRWLGFGLIAAGVGLLPWIIYLAISLPTTTRAWHWSAAWTGLDALEAAGLLATGLLTLRRDVRCCLAALPTSGLLLADAWFDVATARPGAGQLVSIVMAIAAELPAAAACLAIGVAGLNRLVAGSQQRANSPPVGSSAAAARGPEPLLARPIGSGRAHSRSRVRWPGACPGPGASQGHRRHGPPCGAWQSGHRRARRAP